MTAAVAVPGTAGAAGVYRDDDGVRETAVFVEGGDDLIVKRIYIPPTHLNGATGAKLWVYGQATGCGQPGEGYAVDVLGVFGWRTILRFDSCAVFPQSSFGWHELPIDMGRLREGDVNTFKVRDFYFGSRGNAYVGVDSSSDHGRSDVHQEDPSFTGEIPGELMMYVELTGSVPYAAASPPSVVFGVHELGTSTTRTVTVTSGGREPLDISSVTLAGANAADFAVPADGCTGAVLAPEAACTFDVTFTPSAKGSRYAAVTVSTNAGDRIVPLHGEGKSDPPVTVFTTPDLAILTQLDSVAGTVSDDTGVSRVEVTLTPVTPGLGTATVLARLSCDPARTACGWSTRLLSVAPGRYTVTAQGTDTQGMVEPSPPRIEIVVA